METLVIFWFLLIISLVINIILLYQEKIAKRKLPKAIVLIPFIICIVFGAIFTINNPDTWNFTRTTHWVMSGTQTDGPVFNFFIALIGSSLLFRAVSYSIALIIIKKVKNVTLRKRAQHKRKISFSPFKSVCYYCDKYKSNFPSRICGVKICCDCLKELGFDKLSTNDCLDAYSGEGRFNSVDEVITELKIRKKQ